MSRWSKALLPVPPVPAALSLAVLISAALVQPAAAQFGPGARALGMGGALVGLAHGFEAIYWNPANLALANRPSSSFGLVQPATVATSFGPDLRELAVLAEESPNSTTQAQFLADVPAAGLELRADATIPWVSVSMGPFAFGVATTALAEVDISREMLELYLDTRGDGQLNSDRIGSYRIGDTSYRDAAFTNLIGAFAIPLEIAGIPFTMGVTGRFVVGHRLDRGRLFEPVVQEDHLVITGIGLRATDGRGFGMDVGATARPVDGLTVGLAIQNVIQRLTWDERLQILGDAFTSDELSENAGWDLLDRFEARPFDPAAAPLGAYLVAADLLTEAYPPRVVRLGAGYHRGGTRLGATFSSTMGGGNLHAGWPQFLAFGAEQRLSIFSLRGGYANSMSGAHAFAGGAGLRLGSADILLSAARTIGTGEQAAAGERLEGRRFADGLASGSGYAVTVGVSLVSH